jgi:hypothetical protein
VNGVWLIVIDVDGESIEVVGVFVVLEVGDVFVVLFRSDCTSDVSMVLLGLGFHD